MSKHTEGPWRQKTSSACGVATTRIEAGKFYDRTVIATMVSGDPRLDKINAAAIVTAVNAHDSLLAACKAAYDAMLREDFGTLTLVPLLRAAIAKAEPDGQP